MGEDVTARPTTAEVTATVNAVGIEVISVLNWVTATSEAERLTRVRDVRAQWMAQWWTLLRARAALAEAYAGSPVSNILASHAAELGCLASQWLEEHLVASGHPKATSVRGSSLDVDRADILADTHKHAGRSSTQLPVGVVLKYSRTPAGRVSVTLAFALRGATKVTETDALKLLDGCIAAWETFLLSEGLPPEPLPVGG